MPTKPRTGKLSRTYARRIAPARVRPVAALLRPRTIAALPVTLALMLAATPAFSQTEACAALQRLEEQTYGFDPTQLSDAQRVAKSQAIGQFWTSAKALGPQAIPCLRQMLANNAQDPYFLYSGSSLLFSLDTSPESLAAISTALAGADPRDVDATPFINLLIGLARRQVDTGPFAGKYINYESLQAGQSPQGQASSQLLNVALFLYGSMQPSLAETYLEGLVKYGDANARPAAVFALALNLTGPAFRDLDAGVSLDGLSDDDRKVVLSILTYQPMTAAPHTPFSRERVLKRLDAVIRGDYSNIDPANPPYVSGDQAFEVSSGAQLTPADLPRLFEARRMSIHGVTDDSLNDYLALSRTIIEVINRFDLNKKWRLRSATAHKTK